MYRHVLNQPFGELDGLVYARRKVNIPTVLSQQEVKAILSQLSGVQWLLVSLMYGSGLRVMESVRLRVKDFDFHYQTILVRNGKGFKDRVVTFPEPLISAIKNHLKIAYEQYTRDLANGHGGVYIPHALSLKYPNIETEWAWLFSIFCLIILN
ncbi:MAG: tyrosine-type recombinase/integrase [Gammaproteobacteria bacterium]|nr:tyrosine-type recombinase/integrase [Gammaproteobacteria bacterium]